MMPDLPVVTVTFEEFFKSPLTCTTIINKIREGLTFDDVLLVPAYSEILPRFVETTSKFSRNIQLRTPIVSAAMDTVTESGLAIAIAQEGGIGVFA